VAVEFPGSYSVLSLDAALVAGALQRVSHADQYCSVTSAMLCSAWNLFRLN